MSNITIQRTVRVAAEEVSIHVDLECMPITEMDPVEIAKRCSNVHDIGMARKLSAAVRAEEGNEFDACVYVMGSDGSPFRKIGFSRQIHARPARLMNESICSALTHGAPMHVRSLFWMTQGRASMLEAMCLRTAGEQGIIEQTEWLRASTFQAAVLVATCAKALDLKIADSAMWIRNRKRLSDTRRAMVANLHETNPFSRTNRLRRFTRAIRSPNSLY